MTQPNIIYINSHDTGRSIQPYGVDVHTPNLQKLAEDGVIFRNAHCAAPTCSPSRTALTFGQYPSTCGMHGLGHRGFKPTDNTQHIAHTLTKAGYHTVSWGMEDNHTGVGGYAAAGYQSFLEGDIRNAVSFVKGEHSQPFFLSVSFGLTHRAGEDGSTFRTQRHLKDDPRYSSIPASLPNNAKAREDWCQFKSDATTLDMEMGDVFAAVENAGLSDSTLIIATTDHGIPFPGHKCRLSQHGTGVFMIMRGLDTYRGGKCYDSLVSQIDIYPTLCELAGVDTPGFCQGKSLNPLVKGDTCEHHDLIGAVVSYHASYEPKRMIRDNRWVYIKRWGDLPHLPMSNIDRSPCKDLYLDDDFGSQPIEQEYLYDTLYDPYEENNLIYHPRVSHKLEEMREKLTAWMDDTNDPLRAGSIETLDGQRVNPLACVHPNGN